MKLHAEKEKLHGNGNQTGYKTNYWYLLLWRYPVRKSNCYRTDQRNRKETGQHKNYRLASEKGYSVSLIKFDKNMSAKTPMAPFFHKGTCF